MRFFPDIKCPACGCSHHRQSRWLSHDEKASNPRMRPYRCGGCGHRFVDVDKAWLTHFRILLSAGALLLVCLVGIVALLYLSTEKPSDADARSDEVDLAAPNALEATEDRDVEMLYRLALYPSEDANKVAEARERLQESARSGNTEAMIYLGMMYRRGVGVLQDYDLAVQWIQKAADGGDPEGMLELGRLYRDGVGFERDLVRAYHWFNRAAAQYNMEAVQERNLVSKQLSPEQLKTAQHISAGN